MTKKVHVTRFDEAVEERAIQMREDNPISPQETQFWFNKLEGRLAYYLDGEERTLNVRVLGGDPATPNENEIWVNGNTDQLKYKYQGIIHTVNLGNADFVEGRTTSGEYVGVLDEAELQRIADVSNAYPDYLIESFQDIKETVTLTNTDIEQSNLTLNEGQISGTYEREVRKTKNLNYVEGVAVITSQGFAPKTITDNLDGTHTVVFRDDVTDILADIGKLVLFEEDTVEGREEDFPLLNVNGKPAVLVIDGATTYDSLNNETTVIIIDQDLDLTMGLVPGDQEGALRFAPLGMTIEASADGLTGTLESLEILEMHSHEAERVLGEELFSLIPTVHTGSTNKIVVKSSPNKKFWIILTAEEIPQTSETANVAKMYYSCDGLKTLQAHPYVFLKCADNQTNTGIHADYQGGGYDEYSMHQSAIDIRDDGKTILGHGHYNSSAYNNWRLYQFDLSDPIITPELFPSAGGYQGEPSYSTTLHIYGSVINTYEPENIVAFTSIHNDHEPYTYFYKIDFEDRRNSIFLGRCFYGADYMTNHDLFFTKFIHYEGEWQFFRTGQHANNYNYAHSVRLTDILAGNAQGNYPNTAISVRSAFASAPEGGSRNNTVSLWHVTTTTENPINYVFNEEDQELLCFINDNDSRFKFGTINFGRTDGGVYHVETLSVDQVPTLGSLIINTVDGQDLSNQLSPTLNFDDDAAAIQTKLSTMTSTYGAGNVEVTGDWTTGFQITDRSDLTTGTGANPKPITYTVDTNNLLYPGGVSLVQDALNDTSTLAYVIDLVSFYDVAKEFSMPTAAQIDSVDIRVGKTPGAIAGSLVKVLIRDSVSGTVRAESDTIAYETLPDHTNASTLVNFNFSTPVSLAAGTYVFTLMFDTHNGSDVLYAYRTSADIHPFSTSLNNGTSYVAQANDLAEFNVNTTLLTAVTPSFTTDVLGVLPKWLYVTNAVTEKWEETGSFFTIMDTSVEIQENYSTYTANAHRGGRWKQFLNRVRLDGRTIHLTEDIMKTDNDYDSTESYYWKIPDYREILGCPVVNTPGAIDQLLIREYTQGFDSGGRFGQIYTVPSLTNISHYPDGKLPIRTISLYMRNNWVTNASYFRVDPTWRIRVTIQGTNLGIPDDGNVLAQSVHEYRVIDIPKYDDYKWVEFAIPGDLRFLPGESFAIVVEPINFDGNLMGIAGTNYDDPDTSATIDIAGRSVVNPNFFRWNGSIWQSVDFELWFKIYDYYGGVLPVAHKNDARRVHGWASDQWHREDSQSNIEWIDKSAKTLRHHYRNSGLIQLNDNSYTAEGTAAKNFYSEIIDENGKYEYPTLTPAKWLGQAEGDIDNEIRWATVMGHPNTMRYREHTGNTHQTPYPIYTPEGETPIDRFNYDTAFGGLPINSWDSANLGKLAEEGGIVQGVKQDPQFYYGWCTHMRNSRIWYSWNTRALAPGHEDFYFIFEWKPDPEDLDGSWNMLCDLPGWTHMGVFGSQYRFHLEGHDNTSDTYYTAAGTVINDYHFIKYYRDIDGVGFAVSLDGVNWSDIPVDLASSSINGPKKYGYGFCVGDGTDLSTTLYLGGYRTASTYTMHGKIGIVKIGVGSAHPTERGVEVDWNWKDVSNPYNLGDRFIGQKVIYTGVTLTDRRKVAKLAQFFPHVETSKVRTRDQVLRFRAVLSSGTKASTKISLTRNSDADPFAVQGYLLNFENRII